MSRKSSAAVCSVACLLLFTVVPGIGCGASDAGRRAVTNTAGSSGTAPGASGAGDGRAGASSVAGNAAQSAGAMSVASAGTSAAGASSGAAAGHGGAVGSGSAGASVGSAGNATAGASSASGCEQPGLVWKTANKTNYTSYPEPGSDECVKFSGCEYEGLFAACDQKQTLEWVKSHNIVAAFPDLKTLALHDLCLKSGKKTIVVTVYDTCGDSDCDNCCTQNKGNKDELIDIESFTDARWGVPDGAIEWADLGPTKGPGCN